MKECILFMDKTILKLDSGWRIAYEENYICKDYVDTIQDIASLKEKKLPEIPKILIRFPWNPSLRMK